jgi:hypothetical protein
VVRRYGQRAFRPCDRRDRLDPSRPVGLLQCLVPYADQIDREVDPAKRIALVHQTEAIMEQDPPVLPVAWEQINDVWYNYVKGHNPKDYFGIYDVVREDTFWLDKA